MYRNNPSNQRNSYRGAHNPPYTRGNYRTYDRNEHIPNADHVANDDVPKWADNIVADYAKVPFGSSFAQIVISEDVVNIFEQKIQTLWKHGKVGFPGSLAVSILREHIPTIQEKKHFILPKSDGCRFILYAFYVNEEAVVVMFDRNGSHYTVTLSLYQSVFSGTILDGELVTTKDGSTQFQIFDCMATCGNLHANKPYSERMSEAKNFVDNLYSSEPDDPFKIMCKQPCTKDEGRAYMTMNYNDPHYPLNYPTDGLMLVRDEAPYVCGINDAILKVKRLEDNTVDFYAKVWEKRDDNRSRWICDLSISEDKNKKFVQSVLVTQELLQRLGVISPNLIKECVVECFWANDHWEPRKIRRDKIFANNSHTLELTSRTINENLSVKEIMNMLRTK